MVCQNLTWYENEIFKCSYNLSLESSDPQEFNLSNLYQLRSRIFEGTPMNLSCFGYNFGLFKSEFKSSQRNKNFKVGVIEQKKEKGECLGKTFSLENNLKTPNWENCSFVYSFLPPRCQSENTEMKINVKMKIEKENNNFKIVSTSSSSSSQSIPPSCQLYYETKFEEPISLEDYHCKTIVLASEKIGRGRQKNWNDLVYYYCINKHLNNNSNDNSIINNNITTTNNNNNNNNNGPMNDTVNCNVTEEAIDQFMECILNENEGISKKPNNEFNYLLIGNKAKALTKYCSLQTQADNWKKWKIESKKSGNFSKECHPPRYINVQNYCKEYHDYLFCQSLFLADFNSTPFFPLYSYAFDNLLTFGCPDNITKINLCERNEERAIKICKRDFNDASFFQLPWLFLLLLSFFSVFLNLFF